MCAPGCVPRGGSGRRHARGSPRARVPTSPPPGRLSTLPARSRPRGRLDRLPCRVSIAQATSPANGIAADRDRGRDDAFAVRASPGPAAGSLPPLASLRLGTSSPARPDAPPGPRGPAPVRGAGVRLAGHAAPCAAGAAGTARATRSASPATAETRPSDRGVAPLPAGRAPRAPPRSTP